MHLHKLILERDLPTFTGLHRSQIKEKISKGTFPKPVQMSERRKAWLESELIIWQQARIAERGLEIRRKGDPKRAA
jgi:prophage regulatory protein